MRTLIVLLLLDQREVFFENFSERFIKLCLMEKFESFAFGEVQLRWRSSCFAWELGYKGRVFIFNMSLFFMWNIDRLEVYKRVCLLIPKVYSLIGKLPREEKFGLGNQLRRATVSVKSNMKEGSGKRTSNAFIAFLEHAMGSLREVRAQVEIGIDLGFFGDDGKEVVKECWRLERMLAGYIDYVRKKNVK